MTSVYMTATVTNEAMRERRKAARKAEKRAARMAEQDRKVAQSNVRDAIVKRIRI